MNAFLAFLIETCFIRDQTKNVSYYCEHSFILSFIDLSMFLLQTFDLYMYMYLSLGTGRLSNSNDSLQTDEVSYSFLADDCNFDNK